MVGGTVLGRVGSGSRRVASHLLFEIRPAGRGAPRIDPKPFLDGWKLPHQIITLMQLDGADNTLATSEPRRSYMK